MMFICDKVVVSKLILGLGVEDNIYEAHAKIAV